MRTPLLLALVLSCSTFTACSRIVTGPSFKHELPAGQTYFGEVYSQVSFTSAGPIKIPLSDADGYFLVSALDGTMFSFEGKQGKRREKRPWAKLPKGIRSTPIFDPTYKHILVGCYDRQIHALDMLSGAEHWYSPVDGYVQAPIVLLDGTLVIGTLGGTVYGIASVDGAKRWDYDLGGDIYGRAGVHPAWKDRAVVGNAEGRTVVLDTASGKELASFDVGAGLHAGFSVTIVEGEVRAFNGTDTGMVQAWRIPATGEVARVWESSIGGEIWAPPALAPLGEELTSWEQVAVYAVSINSNVTALNGATGAPLWEVTLEPKDRLHATPLVLTPYLYVGSLNHHLYCLDRTDGAVVWDFEAFGEFRTTPLLDQGRIIAVSNDHFLYALTWDSGEPIVGDLVPSPAPMVLDLTSTTGVLQAEQPVLAIDEVALTVELTPVIEEMLAALNASDIAKLTPYLAASDPNKQSAYAVAITQDFKPFMFQQHEVRTIIPATAGDVVVVLNVQALQDGVPVRVVLTLRMLKDASKTPAWRVQPGSLKPETVIQVPVIEN